ncbi:MAG: DNA primase [Marinilabiliales bacterium]|nr:MAG: DNA primase [Marinilabiliales bacterium]
MIKPDTIQSIFEASRIEEVIGDFVSLKKRGANYLGLCPFHNEKTPSFSVSPSKGIYKCFGCGKAGNSVNFIMEHEHYSYPEALKWLAKKYNIEVEEEQMTEEMQQEFDERESMFALNSFVSKYFNENLFENSEGKSVGLSYLKERGFLESTIKKFELGYAIDNWNDYSAHAEKNGYKKDVIVKTGLGIEKDDRLIDRFRGRVMFPIHNLTGKVIGFGGRILSSTKTTAKYLNSPESEIYLKSKVLYGIYFARTAIVKQDNCYLVEGYTDVISMHQNGVENVVASSGTSLTVDQIKLIKRFTPNITILYDGDPAGIKASFRGIDLILAQGMNVKIVLFPEGEDPDSFAQSHRTSEITEYITTQAKDFISFKTNLLLDETKGDPSARAKLIKEIVQTISHIPDGIGRTVFIQECSTIMNVPEQTLMNQLNKVLRDNYRNKTSSPEIRDIPFEEPKVRRGEQLRFDPLELKPLENEVLKLILNHGSSNFVLEFDPEISGEQGEEEELNVLDFVIDELNNDNIEFTDEVNNKIINELKKIKSGAEFKQSDLINNSDPEISKAVINLITDQYELSQNWEKNKIFVKKSEDLLKDYVMSTVLSLKSKHLARRLRNISEEMKNTNDEAELSLMQMEYHELKKISALIDNELERTFNH